MKDSGQSEGFLLLDAVISLLVVSVVIIEILVFVLNASGAAVRTNRKIIEAIDNRNRSAIELFEK